MVELSLVTDQSKFIKPIDILTMMDKALEESLLKHVDSVQEIIHDMLVNYVKNTGSHEDTQHIQFSIEVIGRNFKIKPHNLYTFILSDGICIPYAAVKDRNRYVVGSGTYVYDHLNKECIFAPYHEIDVNKRMLYDK